MDQFIAAYMKMWQNALVFEGRTGRGDFWRAVAVNVAVAVVLSILTQIAGIFFILQLLYGLATIVPGIALGIRRLHDIDKPGIMILIGLIPIVGFIILLVFYIQEGTPGPNQYGPQPVA